MQKTVIQKNTTSFSRLISTTGLILASLILASCSGAANFANGDSQKRNEVTMIKIPFMMTFEAGSTSLSDNAVRQLDMFMMRSNVSYGDELSMDFPLNRDGGLSDENQKRLAFLTGLLKNRGLHLAAAVTPYGMSPSPNKARLLISRYVVTPPRCGDWSQPSTGNYGNMNLPDFGCSTQASLGLMVANPRDLITGATGGSTDAEKAAKSIHTYRTKKPAKSSSGASSGKAKKK
ncbi:MAG: CpaD family pilus assembly protein [Emcibacter sp.]|nr:CpaD family pilus assembly protein [Emcibacter sp.]